ncbi:MAG: hypothetical protein JO127_17330 [Caulobacteraceae bacterium]|nr:hypothetical protein [Caulobacteraceae bacterium]
MRHARPEALDRIEPLLAQIRAFPRLTERSRGVFYLKSKAFLHFHEDPAGLFADIRTPDGTDFDRFEVSEPAGEAALLARVSALAGSA